MPSPIAHLSMGACLWFFLRNRMGRLFQQSTPHRVVLLGLFLLFAMLPDFDAIPGLLTGDMGRFHNQQTHSVFFGLATSALLAALLSRFRTGVSFARWFGVIGASWGLHLLMDLFTRGRGLRLFWPLSGARVSAPVEVFRGYDWSSGLWHAGHLPMVVEELGFALLLVVLCVAGRRFSRDRA